VLRPASKSRKDLRARGVEVELSARPIVRSASFTKTSLDIENSAQGGVMRPDQGLVPPSASGLMPVDVTRDPTVKRHGEITVQFSRTLEQIARRRQFRS
jgi:hypothetical protein